MTAVAVASTVDTPLLVQSRPVTHAGVPFVQEGSQEGLTEYSGISKQNPLGQSREM